jgi:selT/selW/selH-like putative selenoprotein
LKRHPDANVSLRKTGGGVFEVTVDEGLVFSKKATKRFPTDQEIESALR